MDLTRQIDIYCERVSAAFWAEPLNALTNVAFILAGVAALWLQGRNSAAGPRRMMLAGCAMSAGLIAFFAHSIGLLWGLSAGPLYLPLVVPVYGIAAAFCVLGLWSLPAKWVGPPPDWCVAWLSGNAIVVGIGSFLFHTYATPWAGMADTAPILLFILGYFAVAMRRFAGVSWRIAALLTLGFFGALVAWTAGVPRVLGNWGGPTAYLGALLGLFGVGLWLWLARAHAAGGPLMRAAGVFAISLGFRTLDGPICDWLPIGTHWLWHLFNGLLFWLLLLAVIRHGPAPSGRAASA